MKHALALTVRRIRTSLRTDLSTGAVSANVQAGGVPSINEPQPPRGGDGTTGGASIVRTQAGGGAAAAGSGNRNNAYFCAGVSAG
ncbi:MAG: hypothetical protein U0174_24185 [Polyangiaceae bacterium]